MFLEDMNQWLLLLENENDPEHYPMNWKAVCEYVEVEAGTYLSDSLPDEPVDPPPN